jgi:hypothetical protein
LASTGRQFAKLGRTIEKGLATESRGGVLTEESEKRLLDIEARRQLEQESFAPLEEQRPIATTAGEITGAIAATGPIGGPAGAVTTKAAGAVFPKLAPIVGFAAAGAIEEGLLEGNPLIGAAFGAGGGVAFEAGAKVLKMASAKLQGVPVSQVPDVPEEIIIQLQQEGISIEDLGKAAENIFRENFDPTLSPQAQARQARAGEFGTKLTSAQASKDFAQQQQEDLVRKSGTKEGQEVAGIIAEQQQQFLKGAEERLLNPFGSTLTTDIADKFNNLNVSEAGRVIRGSLQEVKTRDANIIDNLYKAAKDISGEQVPLNGVDLAQTFLTRSDFDGVTPRIKKAMLKNLARFGVIGKDPVEKGTGTIVNFKGDKIRFEGKVDALTVDNAESLRKAINRISTVEGSDTAFKIAMLDALDNSFGEAIEGIPSGQAKKEAIESARSAFSSWKDQFDVGDDITRILTFQDAKGNIPVIPDNEVLNKFIVGKNKIKNTQRLKQALLSSPTANSKQAWKDVQTIAMESFLKNSTERTTNAATGEVVNVLSGNKLKTQLEKMGADHAKILFGPEMTATLKRLTEAVGDATIPIRGATNPSESGTRVANVMKNFINQLDRIVPGAGGRSVASRAIAKDQAEAQALKDLQEGLASVKGQRLPRVEIDKTFLQWIDEISTATVRPVPATGAAAIGTQELPENQ